MLKYIEMFFLILCLATFSLSASMDQDSMISTIEKMHRGWTNVNADVFREELKWQNRNYTLQQKNPSKEELVYIKGRLDAYNFVMENFRKNEKNFFIDLSDLLDKN